LPRTRASVYLRRLDDPLLLPPSIGLLRVAYFRKVKQVSVQLPAYADNVALPAFARCCCCARGTSRSIFPARRAHSSKPVAEAFLLYCGPVLRQTDRRTDTVSQDKHLLLEPAVSTVIGSRGFSYAVYLQYGMNSLSKFAIVRRLPLLRGTLRHIIFPVSSLSPASRRQSLNQSIMYF